RELAVQIEEEAKILGKYLPFKTGSFYGGVGYAQQEKLLKENAQILVGTPGRVLDLNKSGRMKVKVLEFHIIG
ncbi:DEAD/DEAH box helicase, partial [Treponema sp. R6D11]